jgi:GAF domain-containing protein
MAGSAPESLKAGSVVGLLRESSAVLAGGSDLDAVLDGCARAIVRWVGAAFARIWLASEDGRTLVLRAGAGRQKDASLELRRVRVGEHLVGAVAASRAAHVTNDIANDPLLVGREWAAQEGMVGFAGHPLISGGELVGVMALFSEQPLADDTIEMLAALADAVALGIQRIRAEQSLRIEADIVDSLYRVSASISRERNLAAVVQSATDGLTKLTGAQFGAFFYNAVSGDNETYQLYALSGADSHALGQFSIPRNTAVFEPTFRGTGIVRSDDITADPRYGHNPPFRGIPPGHPKVRSYLAVPVVSHTGEVIGGMLFGHSEAGMFSSRDERIAVGIASHAALAVDSARLYEAEHVLAVDLQRSLLPHEVPDLEGLDVAVRYIPVSTGLDIGGDWYDVTLLPDGRAALSVGDAMGHDLSAASAMTRVRNIMRVYAVDGHDPAEVLERTDRILTQVGYLHMTTALHVQYDPTDGRLTIATAGHLLPVIREADGVAHWLRDVVTVGAPLGIGAQDRYAAAGIVLEPGATLVMCTDGLVERRRVSLPDSMQHLADAVARAGDVSADDLCDFLVSNLAGNTDDDMAVLVVHRRSL